MRLFTAIELPAPLRQHLAATSEELRQVGDLSLTRELNLHITLKFLGEVADVDVPAICDSLRQVEFVSPIHLTVNGIVLFPERGPIRIVAAAFTGNVQFLIELQERIETACQPLGFPRESRRFTPHATLARCRNPLPAHRRGILTELGTNLVPDKLIANEFVLMQSTLTPAGPRYEVVARFAHSSP